MNKYEYALKKLDENLEDNNWEDSPERESIEMLVERATPEKVKYYANGNHLPLPYCPICKETIQTMSGLIKNPAHCPCGQALKWEGIR